MFVPQTQVYNDYVVGQNGRGAGFGRLGQEMAKMDFDPGLRRPYLDERGRLCVTINTGRYTTVDGERRMVREKRFVNDLIRNNHPGANPTWVVNATTLRKEEWIELDRVVLRAARYRLRAWADLAGTNSFGGFNGMMKMILEHETMSDPGEAVVDMDGLTPGRRDRPKFQLQGLPLPIMHSDFSFLQKDKAAEKDRTETTEPAENAGRPDRIETDERRYARLRAAAESALGDKP